MPIEYINLISVSEHTCMGAETEIAIAVIDGVATIPEGLYRFPEDMVIGSGVIIKGEGDGVVGE